MEQQHKSTSSIVLLICNAVLGAFFFGYSISYMNPAIATADQQFGIFDNATAMNGLINALPAIGAAFGALFSGPLLSKMSLRDAFVVTDIIGMVGYGLQLPLYIGTLLVARFIIGLAVGLNSSLVPQYIKEFSPKVLSGPFGAMNQMTINCGSLLALIMGMFFAEDHSSLEYMRFVFDFPMLICAFRILFLSYIYRDAPPSYYLKIGNDQQAKAVISHYYKREYVNEIYEQLKYENELLETQKINYKDLFTNPAIKKRLFVGCSLQVLQQLSGINAVMIYSSGIFSEITNNNNTVKNYLNIGVGVVNITSSLFAIFILNKVGRRFLLLYGTMFCTFCLGAISLTSAIKGDDTENQTMQYLIVIFMYLYLIGFQLSLGPVVWIYNADILPDKGISISVLCNWTCCALVAQFFGIINDAGGMSVSFGIFFICCGIGIIFVCIFVLETKDKSQQTIENMFSMVGKTGIN